MTTVYVVVENGVLYTSCYSTYESARDAVTAKYKAELTLEWEEIEDMNDPDYQMASQVDVEENESGSTYLYIENGIHIIIQRYGIPK